MIFHNIHTITIGEFELMLKLNEPKRILRIPVWLPEKVLRNRFNKLLVAHNENSNPTKIDELVEEDFDKLDIDLELQQFQILQQLIGIWYKTWGETRDTVRISIDEIYERRYSKKPTEEDFIKVIKDKNLLMERAEQTFKKPAQTKKYDFSAEITGIQKHFPTVRKEILYLLPSFIDQIANQDG